MAEEGQKVRADHVCFQSCGLGLESVAMSELNLIVTRAADAILAQIRVERPEHSPELILLARLRLYAFELLSRDRKRGNRVGWAQRELWLVVQRKFLR